MDEINQRIDQLQLGEPQPGDYGVFRDMLNSKTKRYLIPAEPADNFEWDSVAAAAGDYDEDDVTTYGGNWYQSTVDNNNSVPGVDATWTLLTRAVNWIRWTAGVFVEDDVFVIRTIDGEDHIAQLVDAARPYVSSNFDTEYAAGDWKSLSQNKIIKAATVGVNTVSLDVNYLKERDFNFAAIISEIKTWSFVNAGNLIKLKVIFEIDGLYAQTFPGGFKLWTLAGLWNDGTKVWTPTDIGIYELEVTLSDGVHYGKLFGPL